MSPLRYRLLQRLRDDGPVSRAELAARLDVPRSRLAAELDTLTDDGLVREAGLAASRGGRRSPLIELDPGLRLAAVDLGATSLDVEITNGSLETVAAYSEQVDIGEGPRVLLRRVNDLLAKARADGAYDRLLSIGIGIPGPVSFRDGVPISPPIMPGWDHFPLRELLGRDHSCPVAVDNDVNIMAIGERHGGVARSVDTVLFVKIGTGIGCGIHIDGAMFRGPDGCAGDIGHIQVDPDGWPCSCGNTGCLEAHFGGAALTRDALAAARDHSSPALAARLAEHGTVTPLDVAEGAAAGDLACIALIRDGGNRLGVVLAGLVSFINPSMIVIGGGLAGLGHVLLAEIRSVVYRRSLPMATGNLPVVLSELGPRAGVIGAAVLASDLAYGQPL
ncbi:sugar kinase [Longispora fulva]|uniref:Glucokinase-like ROK family protein n=1 Tax=Longispora fulva TaxID=619741 RepID=A0A8J7KV27_9ACTN|nr:ROK family protein [Longispora fulva]MBG6134762.1 glucokinase-like ROK family protein [Longispora fulva]GIG61973.1 sugar kinase [Longispora fulva]